MSESKGGAGFFEVGAVAQGQPASSPDALPQTPFTPVNMKTHPVRVSVAETLEAHVDRGRLRGKAVTPLHDIEYKFGEDAWEESLMPDWLRTLIAFSLFMVSFVGLATGAVILLGWLGVGR